MDKNTKGLDAVILEDLYELVHGERETNRKNYQMWCDSCQLSRENPEEFYKQESESGLAIFDDPPKGWGKEQLYCWAVGYNRGRQIETGNINGILRIIKIGLEELLDKSNFGFKKECPTLSQVNNHQQSTLMGKWILNYKVENEEVFGQSPACVCLKVEKNKIKYFDGDDNKWKIFTKKEQKLIVEYMPLNAMGLPSAWTRIKDEEKIK